MKKRCGQGSCPIVGGTTGPASIRAEVQIAASRNGSQVAVLTALAAATLRDSRTVLVLELFLKRNGIKVEVYTERASVSPIKAKGHLHFNVWVSCASLQGMLESLYKDIDVFILDRGVFDALVWNEWLQQAGKITQTEANQVRSFFTMSRWTNLIDALFVLRCDPEISIDREYSDQLTTKRGTIMEEGTLQQFLSAIDTALNSNKATFKNVIEIDTTRATTREGVTRITDEALKALDTFLDEHICVVPLAQCPPLPESGYITDPVLMASFLDAIREKRQFVPRSSAESNLTYIQPIPCAILRHEDQVLFLKRKKPGHPLHDTYAIWAGGHVNKGDDCEDVLIQTLERELSEEVFIKEAFDLNREPIGLLRSSQDARASRHIGVLYEVNLNSRNVALALNQKEFRETRGSSMSGRLVPISCISEYYLSMGDWSKSIVRSLWPQQAPIDGPAPSLFGNPTD